MNVPGGLPSSIWLSCARRSARIKVFVNMQPATSRGRFRDGMWLKFTVLGQVLRCNLRQEEIMANGAIAADQKAALERLIQVALGDTGQSRKVASFLLAWWNAEECGGFDLTDLWRVDTAIAADMVAVFRMVAERNNYPDTLGFGEQLEKIVASWRSLPKASTSR